MGLTLDILLRRQGAPTVGADLDGSGATARMEASLKRQAEYQKVVARGARDYGVAATAAFTRVEGLIDQLNGNLKETTRLMREAETVNRDVARQTQRTADSSAQGWARMERQLKRNNELTALSVRALRGIGTAGAHRLQHAGCRGQQPGRGLAHARRRLLRLQRCIAAIQHGLRLFQQRRPAALAAEHAGAR